MTIPRIQYDGDGTTVDFAFPFRVFEDDEVAVYVDAGLVDPADYAVALLDVGGTVLFDAAPADGTIVTLIGAVVPKRIATYQQSGAFRAEVINAELDRAVAVLEQLTEALGRALVLADTDTASGFSPLPAKADLAGKLLGFDDDGEPMATDASGGAVAEHTHDAGDLTDEGDFYAKTRGTGLSLAASTISVAYGTSSSSACVGNDARLSDARTPSAHTHAASDLTDEGDFYAKTRGTGLGLSGGTISVTYGTTASSACVGNDSRLSDARTPSAHTHAASDLTDEGDFYAKTRGPGLDDSAGTISVAYGTSSSSACAGDDARLSDQREPSVYDILCGIAGLADDAETVLLFVVPRAMRIATDAAGSYLKAGTAATGSSVFSVKKNGSQFLTATVAASGTTATFSGSQTDFAAGDVLSITAPGTADATLADIAITLAGTLL